MTDDHLTRWRGFIAGTCVHHRGTSAGATCAAGVVRATVQDRAWPTWPRDPCFQPPGRPPVPNTCPHRRLPTAAEVEETMAIYEGLAALAAEEVNR
jgi:hypothetical protein